VSGQKRLNLFNLTTTADLDMDILIINLSSYKLDWTVQNGERGGIILLSGLVTNRIPVVLSCVHTGFDVAGDVRRRALSCVVLHSSVNAALGLLLPRVHNVDSSIHTDKSFVSHRFHVTKTH